MKLKNFISAVFMLILFSFCEDSNVEPKYKFAQGVYSGDLGNSDLTITMIEGEFENSPTITGSAYITSDTSSSSYLIMNGTHNSDSIWFSLYDIPPVSTEDYQIRGIIRNNTFSGRYIKFDETGSFTMEGTFFTVRSP